LFINLKRQTNAVLLFYGLNRKSFYLMSVESE